MSDREGIVPKSLAIVPFPSFNLKGFIKSIVTKDKTRRGGIIDSSITVLFNETNDVIFYRYIDVLETLFNETAGKLNALLETKADKQKIEGELLDFYNSIINLIINSFMKKKEKAELKTSLLLLFNLVPKNLDKVINALILGDPVIVTGDKTLVKLIIDTISIFCVERTPEIIYWTKDYMLGDIIGGPSKLEDIFKTSILVDLKKGKVNGGESNKFCKKLINRAKYLDSEQAEQKIKNSIKSFISAKNELLEMVEEDKVNPINIDNLIANLDLDELDLIGTCLTSSHPDISTKITNTISECRKKLDKVLSGFGKETW
ncbi:MAG: hypothetical protein HWN67_06190 [Candidatus Helarchaeota archaeon]|nr:hypothetical protein [Candidatus Helarchaeota archaeon]